MLRKLSDVYFDIDESRSVMISNAGDLTTDEQVTEAMEKAVKLQLEKNEAPIKAFDAALGKIISEQKWGTPLGPSKLADYEALVCSKLGISSFD